MRFPLDFMKHLLGAGAAFLLALPSGCIKNDIPYPYKPGEILAIEVEGQSGQAAIDLQARTVSLQVVDTADLHNLKVLEFRVTDSTSVEPGIDSVIDLSQPRKYVLTTYPDQAYEWTVSATQNIERYIIAENQVGDAVFNVEERQAILYVSVDQPLDAINIIDVQLGPSNSSITPDPRQEHDYSTLKEFEVAYRDVREIWTISAVQREIEVETGNPDAWASFAYLTGMYSAQTGEPSFLYREASSSEWTEVPSSEVVIEGHSFEARVTGLKPGSSYVYKAVAGDLEGDEVTFVTEDAVQMINMDFDDWIKEGKSWFPNADLGSGYWWDSGNRGANAIGENNPTSPEEDFVAIPGEGKMAARMETVVVAGFMAGGNIFSGEFLRVAIPGAEVAFGRPFTSRPLQLKGYYSYSPVTINKARSGMEHMLGRPDRCHIFVYVTDWDAPYVVDTNKEIYLDVNDPHVIGYGSLVDSVGTGGAYREFTVDIKYRNKRKPTYCAVVAVASQYADLFTGGVGSLMYADEFSFVYDGDVVWEEGL